MVKVDKEKLEEERRKRAEEYDKKIFGQYFNQVVLIFKKIKKSNSGGFPFRGKTVIGVSKIKNEEPQLVFAEGASSISFSEINF